MKTDALTLCLLLCQNAAPAGNPVAVRMLDLNGDGLRDRLEVAGDGTLAIALNLGQRVFEPVLQELPRVVVRDVLAADLDRDGHGDLFLVSPGASVALLGDGTGRFFDATVDLGLADLGAGLSAELEDLDGDGLADLLLHGELGDVLLWARQDGAYERDASTPALVAPPGAGWSELAPDLAPDGVATLPDPPPASAGSGTRIDTRDAGRARPGSARSQLGGALGAGSTTGIQIAQDCAQSIEDQSSGSCLQADSTPTLGRLYPQSLALNVNATTARVGVGTTAPTHKLTVSGALRAEQDVLAGYGTVTAPSFRFGSGSETSGLSSPVGNSVSVLTSALERMRITAAGDVGIGTSAPTARLDVNGNAKAVQLDAERVNGGSTTSSPGVLGSNSGSGPGISGYTQSASGRAASFQISNSANDQSVVTATTNGTGKAGLFSITSLTSTRSALEAGNLGNGHAVSGFAYGDGAGVNGENWDFGSAGRFVQQTTSSSAPGVYIEGFGHGPGLQVLTHGSLTYGIYSESPNIGIVGRTTDPASIGILCQGNFSATGSKFFVAPHPTDPSREIRFACLEGNESGTYFRGTARLSGGRAVVEVPEEFRLVSESEGLSAQLTAVGRQAALWIESQSLERLVVRGDADVTFHYTVNGVRRGYADHQAIQPNRLWVPEFRGEPFGTQFPDEVRRMLVENGTLNPDFTPNEATAARLGWTLKEREVRPTSSAPVRPATPEAPAEAAEAAQEATPEPVVEPAREVRDEGSTREPYRP